MDPETRPRSPLSRAIHAAFITLLVVQSSAIVSVIFAPQRKSLWLDPRSEWFHATQVLGATSTVIAFTVWIATLAYAMAVGTKSARRAAVAANIYFGCCIVLAILTPSYGTA